MRFHFNKFNNLLFTIPIVLIFLSCQRQNDEKHEQANNLVDTVKPVVKDSSEQTESETDTLILPEINYKLSVLNDSTIKLFTKQYCNTSWNLICALNRIDPNRLHRADSILIPDTITNNLMYYSPFPEYLVHKNYSDRIIFVSYAIQAFALYRNDSLILWGPVSMGAKKSKTPLGLYHTNWKSKRQISTEDSSWVLNWYFNLINSTGVSFHEFELPGFPASHSCIRLRQQDAEFIYYFSEQWRLDESGRHVLINGTPVIIFGEYPWGKTRPWFHLSRNPHYTDIASDSLVQLMKRYFETDSANALQ